VDSNQNGIDNKIMIDWLIPWDENCSGLGDGGPTHYLLTFIVVNPTE
jgi:hypothetical protein